MDNIRTYYTKCAFLGKTQRQIVRDINEKYDANVDSPALCLGIRGGSTYERAMRGSRIALTYVENMLQDIKEAALASVGRPGDTECEVIIGIDGMAYVLDEFGVVFGKYDCFK